MAVTAAPNPSSALGSCRCVFREPPEASEAGPVPSSFFTLRKRATLQKSDGFTEVRADCPGGGRAILRPPLGRLANLTCCSSGNLDPKCHAQPCFGNDCSNSSRVTHSPRSISAMAARSSSSCVSVSEKLSSAPRVTTATTAPSVRETPSTTIFPLTTVPVATCMAEWYPGTASGSTVAPAFAAMGARPCLAMVELEADDALASAAPTWGVRPIAVHFHHRGSHAVEESSGTAAQRTVGYGGQPRVCRSVAPSARAGPGAAGRRRAVQEDGRGRE